MTNVLKTEDISEQSKRPNLPDEIKEKIKNKWGLDPDEVERTHRLQDLEQFRVSKAEIRALRERGKLSARIDPKVDEDAIVTEGEARYAEKFDLDPESLRVVKKRNEQQFIPTAEIEATKKNSNSWKWNNITSRYEPAEKENKDKEKNRG